MRRTTLSTVFLISFLVSCLMVDDSDEVLIVLTNRKTNHNENQKPTVDQSSGGSPQKANQRRPGWTKSGRFPQRKPDRFPEGPVNDQRPRNRFNGYSRLR